MPILTSPTCSPVLVSSHRADLQAKAVELEHETFRNAKMVNLYKASVLKKVSQRCKPGSTGSCSWD